MVIMFFKTNIYIYGFKSVNSGNLRGPPGVWEGAGAPCRLPPSPSWEGSGLSVGGESVKK